MTENIICVCGRLWAVRRYALPMPCQDFAICLCGQMLKQWNEAADYVFEPAGMTFVRTEKTPLEVPDWTLRPVGAKRISRVH